VTGGSLTLVCLLGNFSSSPIITANPCTQPALATGTSQGNCSNAGTSMPSGTVCQLVIRNGYSLASGSLTLSCFIGTITSPPVMSANPCSAPAAPTGTTSGNCTGSIASGSQCNLQLSAG